MNGAKSPSSLSAAWPSRLLSNVQLLPAGRTSDPRTSGPLAAEADAANRRSSGNPVRRQLFVIGPAAVGDASRLVVKLDRAGLGRPETGAGLDRGIPVRRPRAVGRLPAACPAEHGLIPGNAQRRTQIRQHGLRIGEY